MEQLVTALRAIGEPTRLRVLSLLAHGELTVSEMVSVLGQSQPRVSRHIKLLASAGIIERLPEGTWVFYRLADHGRGQKIAQGIISLFEDTDRVMARDLDRLEAVKHDRKNAANAYFAEVANDWAHIRSLHLSEGSVEKALRKITGDRHFKSMLDIGTGTGRMLEVFGDKVDRATGIDLSHEMLNLARLNLTRAGLNHCSVRHSDLYNLPFEDHKFDFVCIHQVLHYLDEPKAALSEAVRVTAPGGLLTIVDFAPHQIEFLREKHAHRRLGFTDTEMENWLHQCGLEKISHQALRPTLEDKSDTHLTVKIWTGARPTNDTAKGANP